MPKINVYEPAETVEQQDRRVEVGWHGNGSVQIGSTFRQPLRVSSNQTTVASGANVPPAVLDEDGWSWDGQFVNLDRNGVNSLIRALREARDKAFGRDE